MSEVMYSNDSNVSQTSEEVNSYDKRKERATSAPGTFTPPPAKSGFKPLGSEGHQHKDVPVEDRRKEYANRAG